MMAGVLLCVSCTSLEGTEYEKTSAPEKKGWSAEGAGKISARQTANPNWWKSFRNAQLNNLIERAVSDNIDLKVLVARTNTAEAAIGQVRAASLPSLRAGAGASFDSSTGVGSSSQFNTATSLSWELDLWGKAKKGVEAQQAEVRATQADWRAGYLSLVSDVAITYFQILQFDEQTKQQEKVLGDSQRILKTLESMQQEGVIENTRVLQQRAEINQQSKDLLEIKRLRAIAENSLATLLGTPAGNLRIPPGTLTQDVTIIDVPAGLPSDLLMRRPDIVAAEYRVLRAYNLTAEAKLARLPSFGLTGRAGSASFKLSDLLKSFTVGILPSLDIPIFDPAVNTRLKVSEAETKVAREEYRSVVIKAYQDVENALVNLESHKQQRKELLAQLAELRSVAGTVNEQLREGMVSQLEVFESGRSLLATEMAVLENKQLILSDTVRLYKALGGGW
ncbi:RND efflux system, outer membrane lipoprotein, NodT family [Thiothrix nivea DSM 5205]|uniref:RND efflux system, outer membrane lipoprotein, NodT family n=2 Tax=Thiothrix nivea TaxID=1031 RepID=A0A656HIB4_THINJ|nr:RND efflux system, outer membrane lipoprotein, NodT family [Thiothrix nivea DSM 5205]